MIARARPRTARKPHAIEVAAGHGRHGERGGQRAATTARRSQARSGATTPRRRAAVGA
jgi:hypothetical protein